MDKSKLNMEILKKFNGIFQLIPGADVNISELSERFGLSKQVSHAIQSRGGSREMFQVRSDGTIRMDGVSPGKRSISTFRLNQQFVESDYFGLEADVIFSVTPDGHLLQQIEAKRGHGCLRMDVVRQLTKDGMIKTLRLFEPEPELVAVRFYTRTNA